MQLNTSEAHEILFYVKDNNKTQRLSHQPGAPRFVIRVPLEVRFQPTHGSYIPNRRILEDGLTHPVFQPNVKEAASTDLINPWGIRDYLFSGEWELGGFLAFSGWTGRFGIGNGELGRDSKKAPRTVGVFDWCDAVTEDLLEWKRLLVAALLLPQSEWESLGTDFPARKVQELQKPFPLKIHWLDGLPMGTVTLETTLDAIVASI